MSLDPAPAVRRLRCALFVDFDNVYLGLRRLDPAAAEAFASSPAHWLAGLEVGSDDDGELTRRFLVRACYLNPSAFSQYRPNFTRAGFSVVDCPSLTQQGKSSADINLVLDAVDALVAPTRYDEFMIVSADADFTPLALRARAADRRVTIVTAGPAAAAYRAVADQVVTADELVGLVKGPADVGPGTLAVTGTRGGAPSGAPIGGDAVLGSTAGDGLDSRTAADAPSGGAERTGAGAGAVATRARAEAAPSDGSTDAGAGATVTGDLDQERSAAARAVLRLVRSADRPLNGGPIAQAALRADPTLATGWGGAGSFVAWLGRAVPAVTTAAGFVWDPDRFSEADLPGAAPVDLPPLQRQVVEVTDIPNLPTERYKVLLVALAQDVAAHPFERVETARRVRNACQAAGEPIGRASVNAVIAGVLYSGLDLSPAPDVATIASTWADYVVGLCRGARMELSPLDAAAIRSWVGGGLAGRR